MRSTRPGRVIIAAALLLATACSAASSTTHQTHTRTGPPPTPPGGHGNAGPLRITKAYIPAPASPVVAAAYFTVRNTSHRPDTLTMITTPLTADAMLHRYRHNANRSERMVPLARLPIPADATISLHPGGKHLMLMHPRRVLHQGQHVTLQLTFTHAGTLRLRVPVVAATGLPSTGKDSGS